VRQFGSAKQQQCFALALALLEAGRFNEGFQRNIGQDRFHDFAYVRTEHRHGLQQITERTRLQHLRARSGTRHPQVIESIRVYANRTGMRAAPLAARV
jgi:hypothetical protein